MRQLLSDSIDDYIGHRISKGIASGTLKNDKSVLKRFLLVTGNLYTDNIHEGHTDEYFRVVAEKRRASSLGVDTATLKGFFAWAIRTRRAGRNPNPMADRMRPRFAPREWRGISVTKVPALLDAAQHPRDRILLAMACFLLGRSVEFRNLRLVDLRLDDGQVSYRIPKTYKVDILPISEELDEELRRWLKVYSQECGPLDPNWYLIPAVSRPKTAGYCKVDLESRDIIPYRPVGNTSLIAQQALTTIGFPITDENGKRRGEGMHTIRRSMARALYEQLRDEGDPQPVETVRAMLNHSTEAQTRHYIGLQSEREHRDARIKGRPMFPGLRGSNVVRLEVKRVSEG